MQSTNYKFSKNIKEAFTAACFRRLHWYSTLIEHKYTFSVLQKMALVLCLPAMHFG